MLYEDERGWQYIVRPGLSGNIFKGFYRKPSKSWRNFSIGWHGMRQLNWHGSEVEAQQELAAYAQRKGWRKVESYVAE